MREKHSVYLIAAGAVLGSCVTVALIKLFSRDRSFNNSKEGVSSIKYKEHDTDNFSNGNSRGSLVGRIADVKTENNGFSDEDLLQDEIVQEHLTRNIQFFGLESQQKVSKAFVVVVGLGGVGSHAATMLLRSGVRRLRLVDFDQVSLSSLNRHAVATREDVGTSKALCLEKHFKSIFPERKVDARVQLYDASSEAEILGGQPDFVLDCIDNIDTKVSLLAACVRRGLKVLSATGAGARADPTRIRIADLCESSIDPLSRAVFGDSKVIIDWASGELDIQVLSLELWCHNTKYLFSAFISLSLYHIFRELNFDADILSKKGLDLDEGLLIFEEYLESNVVSSGTISIYQMVLLAYLCLANDSVLTLCLDHESIM